ncbi:sensor histidine kinase [Actinomadura sp. NTSP31]|uniref:sensor histidine kinase n=1 Tax=Actinomadura sp. NTSP31 TaxID=1735447 RepID=UPI0035C0D596
MIRQVWDRYRRRTWLVDAVFAVPVLLMTVLEPISEPPDSLVAWFLAIGLLAPLVLRRTRPRTAYAAVALVALLQVVVNQVPMAPDLGILMCMYTLAAGSSLWWGIAAGLVTEMGAGILAFRYASGFRDQLASWWMVSVCVAGVWLLGLYMRTRRAYLASLEERAARLERERDTEVQMAMAGERARIARELHDVVAHNVSVIVVQSDGASFAIESDPGRAKRAMETISSTGRQALAEMRRMLGVLRESDTGGSYAPQPGVAQLSELVGQLRSSGLPVSLEIDGVPVEMSEGRQLTVFRIVQEALTNTLKHGGAKVTAKVGLHYFDDAVEIEVSDDGRGAAAISDGRGHGLVGMRERVAVYGGDVEAGPRPGGGFTVRARIPIHEEARA